MADHPPIIQAVLAEFHDALPEIVEGRDPVMMLTVDGYLNRLWGFMPEGEG